MSNKAKSVDGATPMVAMNKSALLWRCRYKVQKQDASGEAPDKWVEWDILADSDGLALYQCLKANPNMDYKTCKVILWRRMI